MRWIGFFLIMAPVATGDELDRTSPFEGVRWEDGSPTVSVDGEWYRLVSLDGVRAEKIVAFCRKSYGDKWQKRFEEDLVPTLRAMGHTPGRHVSLVLTDADDVTTKVEVELTEANRRRLWEARSGRTRKVERAKRDHAVRPAATYAFLARPVPGNGGRKPGAARLAEDLDQLEWLLENTYAYVARRGVDYRAALDAVRSSLTDETDVSTFAIQLMKLLALFGDGHARVGQSATHLAVGAAHLTITEVRGRLVALEQDGGGLLDPKHPYLKSIDGVPVERWLEAARLLAPKGSEHLEREMGLVRLHFFGHLRRELGLPAKPEYELELESPEGDVATRRLRPSSRISAFLPVGGPTRTLGGGIGYLRIADMDDDPRALAAIRDAMERFRETRGLIIDVRGNGGGSRDLLRTLFSYFMTPGDPPRLANIAAYRLPPGENRGRSEGYLGNRSLYPLTSTCWTDAERATLVGARFEPEWEPAGGAFSAWHYFVLRREQGEGLYHYDKPVVILMDGRCFSATDIFLAAFKGWRNVTLMGTPSGGGSGRTRTTTLENSGIKVRLSSMASFRPDGSLYDGAGIEPDVLLEPSLDDVAGQTDSMLERAIGHLRGEAVER